MHGGVKLSNLPYSEDVNGLSFQPTSDSNFIGENSNIPSLSFSINPQPVPQGVGAAVPPDHKLAPIEDMR